MKKKNAVSTRSIIPEKPSFKHLAVVYLVICIVRFVLAAIYTHGPVVMIDESLYTNIARSLRDSFSLAYREQPIDYPYILYPLVLIPLYLFRLPFDLYRVTQAYNILLVTSSVFPVFMLAKKFAQDDRKAFLAAVITALMPDMLMGNYLMSECIIWPLSLWSVYFAYCAFFEPEKIRFSILVAVFTGLLYFTKPGAIAMGAALMAYAFVLAIAAKDKKRIVASLVGVAVFGLLIFLINALYIWGFGYDPTFLALYEKQAPTLDPRVIVLYFESTLLLIFLFVFACGGVYAVMPLSCLKDYDPIRRHYVIAVSLGTLAAIIGTAVFVVPHEWLGSYSDMCLHLRYCAMYVPLFFIFTLPVSRDKKKNRVGKCAYIALIVFMVLIVFPGARIGSVRSESNIIDTLALGAFYDTNRVGAAPGILLSAITILFSGYLCIWFSEGFTKATQRACAVFFAAFLVFNNACGYMGGNIPIEPEIGKDAMEINAFLEDESEECMGITQLYYNDIRTYWLEARLREPLQQVTSDNMVVEMCASGGVYRPFVPVDQSPNIGNGSTPDTDTFILGMTIAEHLELSEYVDAQKTTNGYFTIVRLTPGKRWVDTMMRGLNDNTLTPDRNATIYMFNPDRFDTGTYTLNITAYAKNGETDMTVSAGGSQTTIRLSNTAQTYAIELPVDTTVVSVSGGNAEILSYTTT